MRASTIFGNALPRGLNQRERGDHRRAGVAEPGNEPDQWIDADAKLRAGHADEIIHEERNPAEERLDLLARLSLRAGALPTRLLVAAACDRRTMCIGTARSAWTAFGALQINPEFLSASARSSGISSRT